jgi:two-component system OmpR family response regulator
MLGQRMKMSGSICDNSLLKNRVHLIVLEARGSMDEGLMSLLHPLGYELHGHAAPRTALSALRLAAVDAVIVDPLPEVGGLPFVSLLRKNLPQLPIIIVSKMSALEDRVRGLDAGADNYLVRPVALADLEARLRVILRRRRFDRPPFEIHLGPVLLTMNPSRISIGETVIDLPAGEMRLLETLAIRPGRIVTRTTIAQRLAKDSGEFSDAAMQICVCRLRRRLSPFGVQISTTRGVGYRLELQQA